MTASTRRFEIDDQRWFAAASGDHNPIHVDPEWAARHFPGAQVVHGMHILLWALDQFAAKRPGTSFAAIDATFVKPIVVGDEVAATVSDDGRLIRVTVRRDIAMVARIEPGEGTANGPSRFEAGTVPAAPRPRALAEIPGLAGVVALPANATALATRFGALASALGVDRLIGLAAISTLVGMEVPGLRSMLSKVALKIASPSVGVLGFAVGKFHDAMSLVEIDVQGLGIAGTVSAFAGREPPAPATDEALRNIVAAGEFSGKRPFVISAASGLGATTARLLAAGGADPVLTWHASDLGETLRSVRSLGAIGRAIKLDASAPAQGLAELAASGWDGGEIYYFAAPRIFRRRIELYQAADFRDFAAVFVDGFYDVVQQLLAQTRGKLTVFYPSTVAIDEAAPDLLEYASAKAIGERLCARMEKANPRLKIIVARLPRITTRQTETFLKVKAQSPESVMLPLIRAVQSA
jgi:NADP-dependent 3-hydroxy acid dehydrogenase YdfG